MTQPVLALGAVRGPLQGHYGTGESTGGAVCAPLLGRCRRGDGAVSVCSSLTFCGNDAATANSTAMTACSEKATGTVWTSSGTLILTFFKKRQEKGQENVSLHNKNRQINNWLMTGTAGEQLGNGLEGPSDVDDSRANIQVNWNRPSLEATYANAVLRSEILFYSY